MIDPHCPHTFSSGFRKDALHALCLGSYSARIKPKAAVEAAVQLQ